PSLSSFSFHDPALTEFYTLSLHDALPILETIVTFGFSGFTLILLALLAIFSRWFIGGGIPAHRVFVMFLWLALGGCLIKTRCAGDRKSTRLNSSHLGISYAVFCLKKKKKK